MAGRGDSHRSLITKAEWEPAWLIGWRAAKANLRPGLIVQTLTLGLIISYYTNAGVRSALDQLGVWKQDGGLPFVLVTSAIMSAIFPQTLKVLLLEHGKFTRKFFQDLVFLIPFWMGMGAAVDLLYSTQSLIFGDRQAFYPIVIKVIVDQFGFTPFLASPISVGLFQLRKKGWDFKLLPSICSLHFYRRRVFPLLVAAWVVWIPLVTIVYAMPSALQFPVFCLVNSFWSLMLAMIAHGDD